LQPGAAVPARDALEKAHLALAATAGVAGVARAYGWGVVLAVVEKAKGKGVELD
jgi:hypothetical protein